MTVSSTTSRNEYNGNGTTDTFAYTFRILDEDHIAVYVDDVLQTITTDYTVTGVGADGGGDIVFVSPPAVGTANVIFLRAVPLTQETDYVENDPFPAESHEDALDKLTMIVQQQQEQIGRAITFGVTSTESGITFPDPSALDVIRWNSGGTALENATLAELGTVSLPVPVADGGTGAETEADARVNLGLEIGVDVQAYDADTAKTDVEQNFTANQTFSGDVTFTGSVLGISTVSGFKNKLIGGDFTTNPWQRGTSFTSATTPANSDDTYLADRWYLLSDGNDIVDVTRSADAPTGAVYSLAMDVETANKKFGIAQIVEYTNAAPLIGGTCSLSFKAKVTGTSLTTIKAGVVAWSGTADTVTSDIISAWGADGVTPTLIANATFENTPADLNVTTSWAEYKIEGISIDTASTKNLIVFIWCDNATTTITDFLYVSQVQLESGSTASTFESRAYGQELALCQRYYWRDAPNVSGRSFGIGYNNLTTQGVFAIYFGEQMRVAPSALEQSGTATHYAIGNLNTVTVCNAVPTFIYSTDKIAVVAATVASGLTAGQGSRLDSNNSAAYLGFSAEL